MYNRHSMRCGPVAGMGMGKVIMGVKPEPPPSEDRVGGRCMLDEDDDAGTGRGSDDGIGGLGALPAAASVCASARCANKI